MGVGYIKNMTNKRKKRGKKKEKKKEGLKPSSYKDPHLKGTQN